MNVRDYTFVDYERLLDAALDEGYEFLTVEEYLSGPTPSEPFAVVRHDVDRRVETARSMARVEAERDVRTTYYFRTETFVEEAVEEIAAGGHEIGYHYEELARAHGDLETAHEQFGAHLDRFRETAEIKTACKHGSPLSPHENLDMWRGDRTVGEYDLLGEAYLSIDSGHDDPEKLTYLSDTGRTWKTDLPKYGPVETTDDLVDAIHSRACPRMYVLAHPGRWSRTRREFANCVARDSVAEVAKSTARMVHTAQARAMWIPRRISRVFTRR